MFFFFIESPSLAWKEATSLQCEQRGTTLFTTHHSSVLCSTLSHSIDPSSFFLCFSTSEPDFSSSPLPPASQVWMTMLAAFSAMARVAACVLADTMVGMMLASATRRLAIPCTRSSGSTWGREEEEEHEEEKEEDEEEE